jgi:uncharacterized protein (TIGR03435 family)
VVVRFGLFPVAAILCLAHPAFSQPAFEVATIKPVDASKAGIAAEMRVYPGGRLVIHALPLKAMITAAYDVGWWQLSGGESWMEKDLWDVEAVPAAASGPYSLRHSRDGIGDERVRQMLQKLLAQRFQLKIRRETKTGAVYVLERNGKPFLLRPTRYTEEKPVMGAAGYSGEVEFVGGHWFLFDVSLPQFARFAGDYYLHRPVIDKTGLEGSFDYRDPDANAALDNSDSESALMVFIPEVGLKLRSSKGPVETLVIEHAEKPSGN